MSAVHIIEPVRTPVGKYGGSLSALRPDDMAALVIREVIARTGIDPSAVDDVIMGCANQAGEDNRNISRMALLLAGIPNTVPGSTVNRLCASSLEAVMRGMHAIKAGEADVLVVGGVESMSRAPYSIPKNVAGSAVFGNITAYDTALGWRYPNKKMEVLFPLETMGETAENVAEQWNVSRSDQDDFALRSHQRAVEAQDSGRFADEIVPVAIEGKKGGTVVSADEGPRRDTNKEKLSSLQPAFRKGGSVTAGNSSSLNDGAAAMLLVSDAFLEQNANLKHQVYGRVISSGVVGVDPRIMGIGPVGAIRKACARAGISVSDLDLVEINEAFASQSLACIRDLGIDDSIVNVNGGAISIGHPLGMSGARILCTLVREMKRRNVRYCAAALCIGVGQGLAVVVENT